MFVSQHAFKKILKIAIFWVVAHLQNFYWFDFHSFLRDDLLDRTKFLENLHQCMKTFPVEIEFFAFLLIFTLKKTRKLTLRDEKISKKVGTQVEQVLLEKGE